MRKTYLTLCSIFIILITSSSCKKEKTALGTGKATFYTSSNLGHGVIRVTIGTGVVTAPILNYIPECAFAGDNFYLTEGLNNYTAVATDGKTWSGVINVPANGCLPVRLN